MMVGALGPGCVSTIHKLEPGWDGTTEPDCSDGWGPVVGDVVVGSVALAVGASELQRNDRSDNATGVALAAIGVGTVFEIAALIGNDRIRECRRARVAWWTGRATAANLHEVIATAPPREPAAPQALRPARRGFYCARSTTADDISICARSRDACDQSRAAATLGVPDLAPCEVATTAWCFAGECYANEASCDRRHAPDAVGACDEIP